MPLTSGEKYARQYNLPITKTSEEIDFFIPIDWRTEGMERDILPQWKERSEFSYKNFVDRRGRWPKAPTYSFNYEDMRCPPHGMTYEDCFRPEFKDEFIRRWKELVGNRFTPFGKATWRPEFEVIFTSPRMLREAYVKYGFGEIVMDDEDRPRYTYLTEEKFPVDHLSITLGLSPSDFCGNYPHQVPTNTNVDRRQSTSSAISGLQSPDAVPKEQSPPPAQPEPTPSTSQPAPEREKSPAPQTRGLIKQEAPKQPDSSASSNTIERPMLGEKVRTGRTLEIAHGVVARRSSKNPFDFSGDIPLLLNGSEVFWASELIFRTSSPCVPAFSIDPVSAEGAIRAIDEIEPQTEDYCMAKEKEILAVIRQFIEPLDTAFSRVMARALQQRSVQYAIPEH